VCMCRLEADDACMCPWIASLPEHVQLPLFHYSEADLEACQDENVIREALSIRSSAEAVYEVHGSPWPGFYVEYSMQVCFIYHCTELDRLSLSHVSF